MKGLNFEQMAIVQELHDDPDNYYTVDEARQKALGKKTVSNLFEWEVTGIGDFATTDGSVQNILTHFGHPVQSVVKVYDDLASRVGFDIGKDRKGILSSSTMADLNLHFEAAEPLHLGFNSFLNSAWTKNLDSYSGSKTGIPLYSVVRSGITKSFSAVPLKKISLNDVLKQVSGRPSEVHHLLFKAHYPSLATTPENLMLTERSPRESEFGPGQHELMHMVASGNHKDKFNELLPQYVTEYSTWIKKRKKTSLTVL